MNEHQKESQETFDITGLMTLIFFIVIAFIFITKHVDISRIRFEFKQFERQCIQGMYDQMFKHYPYDANSKTARSTDVSERKIRYIVNK